MQETLKTYKQETAYDSPWTLRRRIAMLLWGFCWAAFCAWTPKPLNRWRLLWLRLFGAKLYGRPFVHQRARIQMPWNLIMHHQACLGDRANAYTLAEVEIHQYAAVAQEAYLCTGTHKFSDPAWPLQTAKITIEEKAFVGARAFVLPGVTVGARAVIGACSVVTRNVPPGAIVVGNPAKQIGQAG